MMPSNRKTSQNVPQTTTGSTKPLGGNAYDRWLLDAIARHVAPARIRFRLRSGGESGFAAGAPLATITIRDRGTLTRLVLDPEVEFGEAYAHGRVEFEGDLPAFLEAIFRLAAPQNLLSKLRSRSLDLAHSNTFHGSRSNIHHHYDLSADFYKLWLDSRLVYTCAYFSDPSMTLEAAQTAKMDYVCRKIQLRPGETVVEAGCGWGALALHMARQYGARVRAFNISKEQIAYAREQAKIAGLDSRVEFIDDDYRNISGHYDAFVSVGMLEHVGKNNHDEFGRIIGRSLTPAGRGLLHFIGRNRPRPLSAWIRKRIFPGGYPPALREALEFLEPLDVSVVDVENLRMHYAWTLDHWLQRFEKSSQRVAQMFGDEFVRMWRLYLAGSMAGFRANTMQLFQVVFAGKECKAIPATRDHLYSSADKELKWLHANA